MKKVYTAGFDIFYPNVAEHMEGIRSLCRAHGMEPFFQGKKAGEEQNPPDAQAIFQKNLDMIDDCDVVAANLNPFRGEMDCGTAFEIGYAFAKGKKVYGYMSDIRSLTERHGSLTDENGFTVENFGYPINLMIACSTEIVEGTLDDCLGKIEKDNQE